MLRHLRARRRPRYGAYICALTAACLLLISVSLLHSRLSFFNPNPPLIPHHDYSSISFNPLLDGDPDSDPLTNTAASNDDRIDEQDDAVLDDGSNSDPLTEEDEEETSLVNPNPSSISSNSNYYFDSVNGVVRRGFNRKAIEEWEDYVPFDLKLKSQLGFGGDESNKGLFGSDDVLVDENLRRKLSEVRRFEDVLLLKGSVLREGWGDWFDKKGDFLRRDRMFKSNIEVLNPLNNPILQDPDVVSSGGGLSRGDRIFMKGVFDEFKKTPFLGNKKALLSVGDDKEEVKRVERRTLDDGYIRQVKRSGDGLEKKKKKEYYADGKRWGYYPGLDGRLSFGSFMDAFFRMGKCRMRVFMVWNSPAWMFGVRQQRVLESLLYHHPDACVVVFSETIELNFFSGFTDDGYKVAVVMPNLDELLKDTPTHVFASVWHDWKRTKHYPTHYSELVRLASLYKYGGIYLDSDVLVLKPLSELNNTVGYEDDRGGKTLNGAVMAFRKHSLFIMECLKEFYASYDDAQLRWNGADLLSRTASKFMSNKDISDTKTELQLQPPSDFFPIGHDSISRYFTAPGAEAEKLEQDVLFNKILNHSTTFHFWNSLTSALIPESESLVFRLLNRYCIHCSDVL